MQISAITPKFTPGTIVLDKHGDFPSFEVRSSVWDEDRCDFKVYDQDDITWAWEQQLTEVDTNPAAHDDRLSYIVVQQNNLTKFMVSVNTKIQQGYSPVGGVAVSDEWYFQAMQLKQH